MRFIDPIIKTSLCICKAYFTDAPQNWPKKESYSLRPHKKYSETPTG